jgi:hypothetical protein
MICQTRSFKQVQRTHCSGSNEAGELQEPGRSLVRALEEDVSLG